MKNLLSILLISIIGHLSLQAQCWQKIASKQDHVIAIHQDGTLWNWGGGASVYRALTIPTLLDSSSNWVDIASGNQFFAGLKSDGSLWVWGNNSFGQLGIGTNTNQWQPTQLGNDNDWTKVSCGDGHMVALKNDGTLWIWGRNNNGQLGKGTNRTNVNIPEQLSSDTDWEEVSAGKNHTLIKKTNGSLWFVGACYGSQSSQLWQVGNNVFDWQTMAAGSFTDYGIKQNGELWTWNNSNGRNTAPNRLGNQNDWLKVDNSHTYSPEYHALFIKNDSTLWAVGDNRFGQLGFGNTNPQNPVPIQVGNDNDWVDAVAGSHYSFALKSNKSFWAWGRNQHAQFGNGENKSQIRAVNENYDWKEISSSVGTFNGHTLGIQEDGSLWAWGQNNDGQLGNSSSYTHQAIPLKIGNDMDWSKISNGFQFSVALKENGTLWTWGRNGRRQLGLGLTILTRNFPTQVANDSDWVEISAGGEFVLAIKSNGTLWAWGYNNDGQLGNDLTATIETPTQIGLDSNWVKLATGSQHALALKSDSTLWSWGSNQHGQLGRTGNNRLPTQVGSDKWLDIAAGGLHTLAIKSDSTLWAWGRNLTAQLGDNSTNTRTSPTLVGNSNDWLKVAAGNEHSLALKTDSTLWTWGNNGAGQTADSTTYTNFLPRTMVPTLVDNSKSWKKIDGGPVNSVAISIDSKVYTWGDSYVADNQLNFPQLGYIYPSPMMIVNCDFCGTINDITVEICAGDSIFFNGQYLKNAGQYNQVFSDTSACDSIVNLQLIILPEVSTTDTIVACDSITWIDGITYFQSVDTVKFIMGGASANGCDSIVYLDLTINNSVNNIDSITACQSYTWIDGITYFESTDTAKVIYSGAAANACDSVVHLHLTILEPAVNILHETACDSFVWVNGITYTQENVIDTFIINNGASNGCDSILVLDLSIHPSFAVIDEVETCGSFTWIDGITYTEDNDTATFTINSFNGCDSIITLNLKIVDLDTSLTLDGVTLIANQNNVDYQWYDCISNENILGENNSTFTADTNGVYAVILSNNQCSAISSCVEINTVNVNNKGENYNLQIFPNPNNGEFIIRTSAFSEIEIYNYLGQAVYRSSIHAGDNSFDFSYLETGIYIVKVANNNFIKSERLIISR